MLSPKNLLGVLLYANIISWLSLLIINLIAFFGLSQHPWFSIDYYLKGFLENFYLLVVFFYFRTKVDSYKELSFIEILIKLFITGLIGNTLTLVLQFLITNLQIPPIQETQRQWITILYHLNAAIGIIIFTQIFFHWKSMILHQISRSTLRVWNIFEYLLLASLLFNFFELDYNNVFFISALSFLSFLGLYLSGNMRWVAYLNAREKWQGILLLLFIAGFCIYLFRTVILYNDDSSMALHLGTSVYVLALSIFIIFYMCFSVLVIIFNLPTSPVFEKKIEDIISFQKLVQALQVNDNIDEIGKILLDLSLQTAIAEAGWVEIYTESNDSGLLLTSNIEKEKVLDVKKMLKKNRFFKKNETETEKNIQDRLYNLSEKLSAFGYQSILLTNLLGHDHILGNLVLLKQGRESFDTEKQELVNTFALQVSLAIDNIRLLKKTIETERYKEESKIAQNIQKSLLPKHIDLSSSLEIFAYSQSAYEVGGDYYDAYAIDSNRFFFIIGDVSGKGTQAAFNMAQMKGIFHALAPLNFKTEDFISYTNEALINCLEKNIFITLTLLLVDISEKKIEIARAGHCPTLFHSVADNNQICFLESKGIGLGIIREKNFSNHLETQTINFHMGDTIFLYTDGIIEATNELGEEFGYERLKKYLHAHVHNTLSEIGEKLVEELQVFAPNNMRLDDHTVLFVRFKQIQ